MMPDSPYTFDEILKNTSQFWACILTQIITMRSRGTPVKYLKTEDMSRIKQRDRSPGQSAVTMRRQNVEFNPGLYISQKFVQQDVIAIKQAFDAYDSNKTGLLTPNDLKVALFHQGFHASRETVYSIIAEYDEDCLGGLNFSAFMKIIAGEPTELESEAQIKKVFRKMDRDNKGHIDRKDLFTLLRNLGDQWEEEDMDRVLEKVDQKEGSKITYEQFRKIMHSPNSIF